jgi:2-keto-3-deoxy-L-arabinonate dehydratase
MAHDNLLVRSKAKAPGTAEKLREFSVEGGNVIEGAIDGEKSITLLADLDAGATGSMTSALFSDQIRPVITDHLSGDRDAAKAAYARVLPTINHDNRQCGFRAAKEAMVQGQVIKSAFCRHRISKLSDPTRAELIDHLRSLDLLILRWG